MKRKKQQSSVSLSKESTPALYDDYRKKTDEENKIRKYVLEKPLNRPRTNWLTIVCIIALYVIISFFLSYVVILLFKIKRLGALIYLSCYLLCFMVISKFLAIKCVECYQHYAKEETRRRCLCKPTCSEYAIAVLKKYPFLVAMIKIKKRLFKTCKGDVYKIDLP